MYYSRPRTPRPACAPRRGPCRDISSRDAKLSMTWLATFLWAYISICNHEFDLAFGDYTALVCNKGTSTRSTYLSLRVSQSVSQSVILVQYSYEYSYMSRQSVSQSLHTSYRYHR